jgi:hypothetical protein
MAVEKPARKASSSPISKGALAEAVKAAELSLADAREEMSNAEDRVRDAERELALLVELSRLRGTATEPEEFGAVQNATPMITFTGSRSRASDRDELVAAVIDVLEESGEPMAIRPLMAAVVERGAPIPGRGEQSNLISVISRTPEIERVARGIYGLAGWGANGTPGSNGTAEK